MPVSLMAAAVALLLSAEAGTPSPSDDAAKLVCKRPSAHLGSRIKRGKTCHTLAEWRAIEEAQGTLLLQTKAPQPEPGQPTRPQ